MKEDNFDWTGLAIGLCLSIIMLGAAVLVVHGFAVTVIDRLRLMGIGG